jgi:hypothetical protein
MDYQTLSAGPDKQVPPGEWIIKRGAADNRRGTLVVPAEVGWIVKHYVADATGASLRWADPTGGSHRNGTLAIQSHQVPKTTYSFLPEDQPL